MNGMDRGMFLGLISLTIFILGGISTFSGIGMIVLLKGRDLMGLGDGSTMGYLFVCVGMCGSVAGVLLMRILRNRFMV